MKIVLSLMFVMAVAACGFAQPQNPPPGNLPGGAPGMRGQDRLMPPSPPNGQMMQGMPGGSPNRGPGNAPGMGGRDRQMMPGMPGVSPGGEQGQPGFMPKGMKDLFENLFPPELVMQNQKALNLTDTQTSAILSEMLKSAGLFVTLQWQQTSEEEALAQLLKPQQLDEKAITAQLGKLIAIEDQIKLGRMQSLVRIKNVLTPEQQEKLKELVKNMGDGASGMDGARRRGGRGFGPPDGGQRK